MATTGPSQTTQDKGATKVRKGSAARVKTQNDTDKAHNPATLQDSRDRDEGEPFHAADDRSQVSGRRWREEGDRRHYDDNRADREPYELNDRQNCWQANLRVDNRGDDRRRDDRSYNSNWRDHRWRETAYASESHPWRENDDWRNEQRNGSEYDRDRGSYGNSRFRDDDYGYHTSRHDDRDYSRDDSNVDPRQPRAYAATSERDYEDRNPSREWTRDRDHSGRGRHR
ncbi:MAG: hypothetical protein QM647_00105 [Asticcacaulis sp.]|uniref:hypothetical protein n=1 Tax=Asticcacaulis sp. TaxID=1872648 RepID=UPI0039E40D37